MTKIKDTPIAGKKWFHKTNISIAELDCELNAFSEQGWEIFKLWNTSEGVYEIVACMNTDLDINEVAEVDVEKIRQILAGGRILWEEFTKKWVRGETQLLSYDEFISQTIAKAGILKWKE